MYIFPLLISSYVGRILLSDGVGKVSFVQNIVSYFTSLVALGIPTYGIREIAKCKTQQERNIVFSSLFTINAISTIVFSIAYYIMIFTVPYFHNNLLLYTIGGIQIVFNFINIDWLYQGLEEYKYIATRSLIVRFVSLICVFAFIHSRKDEWIYLLITCAVNVGNYVLNVFRARKIVLLSLKGISLKKHLRSIFILLATVIAVELYTKIDTTFIGIMLSESDVGYYTYADRIVKIPITIFAAINAVILPRLSVYYMSGEKKEFHELLSKINITVLIFAIPTSVGTCLLSSDYILALFGSNFEPAGYLLKILDKNIVNS
jgi:O-antigen/teichoic acid export membrane protein